MGLQSRLPTQLHELVMEVFLAFSGAKNEGISPGWVLSSFRKSKQVAFCRLFEVIYLVIIPMYSPPPAKPTVFRLVDSYRSRKNILVS